LHPFSCLSRLDDFFLTQINPIFLRRANIPYLRQRLLPLTFTDYLFITTMINGLSKSVALYLAPLLSLTSLVLSLLVFIAPTITLNTQVALLTVAPKTSEDTQGTVDGPRVWLGVLGSCARSDNAADVVCTPPLVTPQYDLSTLSGMAARILTAPGAATPAVLAIAMVFSMIFFFLFTLTSLRHKLGGFGAKLDKPGIQRATAWIGIFGFLTGLSCFLVLRLWFAKAIEDFNVAAIMNNDNMRAASSNGFIMAWVAYSFYTVPLVCALSKLHVTATASK
jgi:hypothetical protein